MKLSIIIPYFNAGAYISDLFESLLKQDFQQSEYEILIIDDGSTQDVSCVLEYASKYDTIRYFRQDNRGVSVARNAGVKEAKGDYVFFCDADDLVAEHSLKDVYEAACADNLDMIFYNRVVINGASKYYPHSLASMANEEVCTGKVFFASHPRFTLGPVTFFIRRNFILENNLLFPEGKKYAEDISFVLDALSKAKRTKKINRNIYFYIQREDSATQSHDSKKKIARREAYLWVINKEKELIHNETNIGFVRSINNLVFSHCFDLLYDSFKNLRPSESKQCIRELRSLGSYPFSYGEYYRQDAPRKYLIIHWIMNHYPLWIALCYLMSIKRSINQKKA